MKWNAPRFPAARPSPPPALTQRMESDRDGLNTLNPASSEAECGDDTSGMSHMENERNGLQRKTQTHEWNARPCAVNVMSFCMQPDAQSVHICGSEPAGVKTPKHRLHHCLDFTVMRYDDRWSERGLQDAPRRPMGALIVGCYYSGPAPQAKSPLSSLYLLFWATWWYLHSNRQRSGTARDWISLFTKQSSKTPVFALNLSLTPRCPFCLPVVLNAIPHFPFFPSKVRWISLPSPKM